MTVIIFAGGDAPRMRPLSLDKPKSMIPFMGKPLLLYLIKALKLCGLSDIILVVSQKHGEVERYFSDGTEFGVRLRYYNGDWYGTAGTVKHLFIDMANKVSDTFMVIYGDSLQKVDYSKMIKYHTGSGMLCTILYHCPDFASFLDNYFSDIDSTSRRRKRTNYGVMDISSDGKVEYVMEKPLLSEIKKNFTKPVANAAVYILGKESLDFIPPEQVFDFPGDLFPLLLKMGIPCMGFDIGSGFRVDIGTIRNYYNIQQAVLEGKIESEVYFPKFAEGVWCGKGSRVKPLENLRKPVLICEDSTIDAGAVIDHSVIGNNVYIGKLTSIERSIVLDNVYIGNNVRVSNSIIGEHSHVEDGVHIPRNSVLGSHCRLGYLGFTMNNKDLYGLLRKET